ncbi:hypothetical protein Tco_0456264, partial [Tanacetum coccineum]
MKSIAFILIEIDQIIFSNKSLEGLIESISKFYVILQEIHSLLREGVSADKISLQLSPWHLPYLSFYHPFLENRSFPIMQLLMYHESDDSASCLSLICNGYEILQVRPLLQATDQEDGSPCLLQNWHGVKCNQSNGTVENFKNHFHRASLCWLILWN